MQALQHSLSVDILPDARVLGDDWEAVDLGIVSSLTPKNTSVKNVHKVHSGTPLIRTPLGQKKVSSLVRCPDFRGCNVHKQGVWDSQMCPVYRGALVSGVS